VKFVLSSPSTTVPGRPGGTKSRLLITAIQIASLLATGCLVWRGALVPRLGGQTIFSLAGEVIGYTLLAWAWSAAVALALYTIVPVPERSEMVPNVFRTAATAVWFAPAMILLSNFSLVSLAPALVLVVYASRLLYAQWQPAMAVAPPGIYTVREPGSFADCQLPRVFVWRDRLPALGVAVCLEAGAIAVAGHYPLLGAAWFCAGTAVLTVFSMTTGAATAGRPATLPRSIVGILATIVLASLMALGNGGRGAGGSGRARASGEPHPGLVETARAVLRQLFYGESPRERGGGTGTPSAPRPETANTGASGGFPGVILWPEIKPITTLIAPLPAGSNPFPGRPAQPMSIPFGGEYWMFRWPFAHPPASSILERGTPSKLAFSTTDHTPLQMEAHQKLETPIDVGCCRAMQLEVLNADRYPGTLRLELVLLDTEHGAPIPLSLGIAPVTSHPDISQDPPLLAREMLEFSVPADPDIDQFNEFKVVFHRAGSRLDKSAKISIERFVLLPR